MAQEITRRDFVKDSMLTTADVAVAARAVAADAQIMKEALAGAKRMRPWRAT